MDSKGSTDFQFEYGTPSRHAQTRGARRPTGRGRGSIRHGVSLWILWFATAILGAAGSVLAALRVDEVRMIGDGGFWTAVIGVTVVLAVSLPGFALYQLARKREVRNWHERVWRPSAWVALSLPISIGAAIWCGYLIAIRIAREWPT